MAATILFSVALQNKEIQLGRWSIHATANGIDILQCAIVSLDGSYRPALDAVLSMLEGVTIVSSSVANPTIITTTEAHGVVDGQTVTVYGHVGATPNLNTDPSANGEYTATLISPTTLSIPANVTIGGTGGTLARRIFGGTITKPIEHAVGSIGQTPITTEIEGSDYNAIVDRRYVNGTLAAGTLKSMLTTIASNYGLTLHTSQVDGPALAEFPCDYALLRDVLDQFSILTGYVWEFDEYNLLRMYLPNTVAAPINIIDGDEHAIGDITVEPTRTDYANRVILRYSAAGTQAHGYLVVADQFDEGETVQLGSQTYTFQGVLTNVAGNVKIGTSISNSLGHLAEAIIRGAGAGTDYAADTVVNDSATAYRLNSTTLRAEAITAGTAGNSIAVGDGVSAAWGNWDGSAISALAHGVDATLTNVSIAEDLAEQAAHGIWEVVIQSPETTETTAADTLAAAYLATHLAVPKTVHYDTYALGLRPGQTQTITITARDVNGTYLITDVNTINLGTGNFVLRSVTAIESVLVQAGDRWRDTYRQWSGTAGGSGTTLGSTGTTTISVTGAIYDFGGSQIEWQQAAAGGWVAANSTQRTINTVTRGSTVGTCYVRLRARAGTVTARLRNVTDGVTVGTSSAVSSTSFVAVSFFVNLTAGSKTYEIDLSPSLANTSVQCGSAYLE